MGQGGLCAVGLWEEEGSSLTACAEEGKGVTAVLLLLFRLHQSILGFSPFSVKSCESWYSWYCGLGSLQVCNPVQVKLKYRHILIQAFKDTCLQQLRLAAFDIQREGWVCVCIPLEKKKQHCIYTHTPMVLNERDSPGVTFKDSLLKRQYTDDLSMHVNNNSYPRTVFGIAITIDYFIKYFWSSSSFIEMLSFTYIQVELHF